MRRPISNYLKIRRESGKWRSCQANGTAPRPRTRYSANQGPLWAYFGPEKIVPEFSLVISLFFTVITAPTLWPPPGLFPL
jgi:hypothetical protein